MDTIDQQIEVLNLLKQGKTVQFRYKDSNPLQEWTDCDSTWYSQVASGNIRMQVNTYNFRAKPEPKIIWINEYPDKGYRIHLSKESANRYAAPDAIRVAVKYQEVL